MIPQALKADVLDYINAKIKDLNSDQDHFYGEIAKAALKKVEEKKFTELLHLMCWLYYAQRKTSLALKIEESEKSRVGKQV